MQKLLSLVWKWLWPIIAGPLAKWVSERFKELLDQIGKMISGLWEWWTTRNKGEQEAVSKKMDQASQEAKEAKTEYQKGYHQGQADTYAEVLKSLKIESQDVKVHIENIQAALEAVRIKNDDRSSVESGLKAAVTPAIQHALPKNNIEGICLKCGKFLNEAEKSSHKCDDKGEPPVPVVA